VVWVRPELVAEVEYRGWTTDDQLRHASFKGLREDKDPREVTRED
jgi:bifunctional non-homologous end joining protein LigD